MLGFFFFICHFMEYLGVLTLRRCIMMDDDEIMSAVVDYSVSTGMDPLDLMSRIDDSYSSFEDLSVDLDMTKGQMDYENDFFNNNN